MLVQVEYIQSHSCCINRYSWIAFELIKTEEGIFLSLQFVFSIQAELFTGTRCACSRTFHNFLWRRVCHYLFC